MNLKIDRDQLDREIAEQPELFNKVAREYAMAVSKRDDAKAKVKLTRAEAFTEVRERNPKATMDAVNALVEQDETYLRAVQLHIDLCLVADQLEADRDALQERGFMLKTLAELWGQGYWGQNSVRGDSTRALQEQSYTENRQRLARKRRSLSDE